MRKKIYFIPVSVLIIVIVIIAGLMIRGVKKPKESEKEEADKGIVTEEAGEEENVKLVESEYLLQIMGNEKGVDISDTMYGLFFEDINFAADGGLYAELIKNRSFEYEEGRASYGALHGYRRLGDSVLEIQHANPIHENNPSFLVLANPTNEPAGFINSGFLEGIYYKEGESYRFSVYLRSEDYKGRIKVSLLDNKNNLIGEGELEGITKDWMKYTIEIKALETATSGKLSFILLDEGSVNVDMVSLFPINTYKNRENGLRKDMVEILEELNPSFIRFPGGCIVEGDSLENAYNWKYSVGDVAYRKQNSNLWIGTKEHPYYQSYGLGFYEYFLLCEDLGAKPIPVVNAGLACQVRTNDISSTKELEQYIQDALDLIEFCNGDITSTWGKLRADMGHAEPFYLEYLAIGNENWDQVYFNRYSKFVSAIRGVYPEIKLITTSGVHSDGWGYNYAWNTVGIHRNDEVKYADLMDEHYYNSADWFLANNHRYDTYERNHVDVFVGEYAAKSNSLYAAVAEAAYMTGLERNGDVVKMASYAPLFGNLISRQWNPDLIYFNNHMVYGSANFYVQKMFANHIGDYTLKSSLEGRTGEEGGLYGKVGLGTWTTSAVFDDVKVVDNKTGEILYETSFDTLDDWKKASSGDWKLQKEDENTVYAQTGVVYPNDGAIMGSAVYIGGEDWSDYTYTLRAKKAAGQEGFLIPFGVKDKDNFYHWNIGGWGNVDTCVEQALGGSKTIVSEVKKISVRLNEWYDIKIEVKEEQIKCYLNGALIHTITVPKKNPVFETVSYDEESGDMIIKIANAGEKAFITVDMKGRKVKGDKGELELLTGEKSSSENTILKRENVVPVTSEIRVSERFVYEAPANSVSVIRIPVED